MMDSIQGYLLGIQRELETGRATEHSYRSYLKALIEDVDDNITAINEPKRQRCGAPDYILTRKEVPVGFIEAKDIGIKLDHVEKTDQMDRYLESLENLILTDYLEFRFYKEGVKVSSIRIAHVEDGVLIFENDNIKKFEHLLKDFVSYHGQTIKSASKLAKTMAGKASLMKDVIIKSLQDEDRGGDLRSELEAFRSILIHDMKEEEFADMYAQTIAYGLFAARLHDPTLETFSRQEAAELLPKTNPFLRKLFHTIAGPDLDTRIVWIVDSLSEVFRATDIRKILESFSSESKRLDPFIHFYETFLSEYDPKLRKARGVWYTPEPVVKFIVRGIDDILKKDFNLPKGLADTSMTTVQVDAQMSDGRYKDGKKKIEKQVHKVQILDPATGTGTFLAEVIKQIHSNFEGQAGIWESYVNEHLLPRIHGFELLMASYAMCHLKLDLLLTELGYKQKKDSNERLGVYLTNSLEEAHPDTNTLFSSWLSAEANEANAIKKETPVMVVLGNPPYSGVSANSGKWITDKIEDYKYIDGVHFKERKHWLQDDYVKFIRFAEHMIEKNGQGIFGYVTNHGFIDNPTFRGMRWHLLKTFDKIYIIDLHGNSKKKELAPNGGKDENVFNIQQGVSIILAIKNKDQNESPAKIYHADIFGKRAYKYEKLTLETIDSIDWSIAKSKDPYYFFCPKDYSSEEEYMKGFKINDLFTLSVTGILTMGDNFAIADSPQILEDRLRKFLTNIPEESVFKQEWGLGKNYAKWLINNSELIKFYSQKIVPIEYRPFDTRYTYFDNKVIWRWREKVMRHMIEGENIGLIFPRQAITDNWSHIQVSRHISDNRVHYSNKGISQLAPLYIYSEKGESLSVGEAGNIKVSRVANLDLEICRKIAEGIGMKYYPADEYPTQEGDDRLTPQDIFDYIYAVLHSPSYREKYKEFLKIDFPRVPYPENKESFKKLVELGGELRKFHLMEHADSETLITQFPESGSNEIEKGYPKFENNKVFINEAQYFDNVPETAWSFHIGGYQPAQKWLKDRRGRELTFDDILHWQKIVVALVNTDRIMEKVDISWNS